MAATGVGEPTGTITRLRTNVGMYASSGMRLSSVDVGDDGGLVVQHRPAADTGGDREPLALPQRRDRVLVGVEAAVLLAEDERRSLRTGEPPGLDPDDLADLGQGLREPHRFVMASLCGAPQRTAPD